MRHVGNAGQQFAIAGVGLFDALRERGDAVAHLAGKALGFGRIGAFFAQAGDVARHLVLAGAQLLGFGNGGAAAGVQIAEIVHGQRQPAGGEALGNRIEIGAKRPQIVHIEVC